MKKVFITMVTICLALSAWSADVPKQGFGIQIGWARPILRLNSMNNPSYAKDSLSQVIAMKGFKVGVVYDASFIKGFGTSLGINYTFGAHTGSWQSGGMFDYPRSRQMFTYHEIEVFADWQYKFEVAKETYLILYTGPTIQCGLGLNMRADKQNDVGGEIISKRYSGYDPNADANNALQRLNVTWGLGAGFQYKRYFLRGGYDFGLINPYRNVDFSNGWHTRGRLDQWSIKLGMYLWYADND